MARAGNTVPCRDGRAIHPVPRTATWTCDSTRPPLQLSRDPVSGFPARNFLSPGSAWPLTPYLALCPRGQPWPLQVSLLPTPWAQLSSGPSLPGHVPTRPCCSASQPTAHREEGASPDYPPPGQPPFWDALQTTGRLSLWPGNPDHQLPEGRHCLISGCTFHVFNSNEKNSLVCGFPGNALPGSCFHLEALGLSRWSPFTEGM